MTANVRFVLTILASGPILFGAIVRDNVLAGADRRAYPGRNRFPRTLGGLAHWRLGLGARR